MKISMEKILVVLLLVITLSMAILLVSCGTPKDTGNEAEKNSSIFEAVDKNDIQAVKDFVSKDPGSVSKKDNEGGTPLHIASIKGQTEIAKLLIEKGADVNAKTKTGRTPLHFALDRGQEATEVAKLLIEKGADVNAKTKTGRTPLHFASAQGQTEVVKLLKEHGAKE